MIDPILLRRNHTICVYLCIYVYVNTFYIHWIYTIHIVRIGNYVGNICKMYICRSLESSLNDRFVFIMCFGRWISVYSCMAQRTHERTIGRLKEVAAFCRKMMEHVQILFFIFSKIWNVRYTSARCPCRLLPPSRRAYLASPWDRLASWIRLWRCVAGYGHFLLPLTVWPKSFFSSTTKCCFFVHTFSVCYLTCVPTTLMFFLNCFENAWFLRDVCKLRLLGVATVFPTAPWFTSFTKTGRSGPNTNYQLINHDAPGGWKATTWWNLFRAESPGPHGKDLILDPMPRCQQGKATFQMRDFLV